MEYWLKNMRLLVLLFCLGLMQTTSANASNMDILKACMISFGSGVAGTYCVQTAHSAELVISCASEFGDGIAGLECVDLATSVASVRTCALNHGNGSAGLDCLRDEKHSILNNQ